MQELKDIVIAVLKLDKETDAAGLAGEDGEGSEAADREQGSDEERDDVEGLELEVENDGADQNELALESSTKRIRLQTHVQEQ